MIQPSRIFVQTILFAVTLLVFSASIYLQYIEGLTPCPLCLMQRICVFLLGFIIAAGFFVKNPSSISRLYTGQIVIALTGVYFAGRQLWIQHLPAGEVLSCVPGLDIMLQYFPWQSIVKALFWGSGDCAEVDNQWFGLSLAGWSLAWFLGMTVISFYTRLRYKR